MIKIKGESLVAREEKETQRWEERQTRSDLETHIDRETMGVS